MSFKTVIKHWFIQKKTGNAYVNLICRTKTTDGMEYYETVEFIKKSELPPGAKNITNYGKYWYFLDMVNPGMDQTPDNGMTASDICTWADNNDLNKSLMELWSWTNNIDLKKVLIIVGAVVVGMTLLFMVK